jgi:hypothetical protein
MVDHILAVPSVYANLAAAIAAFPANLNAGGAGGDRWWIQQAAGSHGAGSIPNIAGADATHFIEVSAAPGVSWENVEVGAIDNACAYAYLHNFSIVCNVSHGFLNYATATNCVFENITINNYPGTYTGFNLLGSPIVINCVVLRSPSGASAFLGQNTAKFYGCLNKSSTATIGFADGYFYNCVHTGTIAGFSGVAGGSYNCSTDATAPGVGSIQNADVDDMKFADYGGNDFAIGPLSILAGTGGDQPSIYTQDIDGNPITLGSYPIGPYTYVAPTPRTSMMILVDKVF